MSTVSPEASGGSLESLETLPRHYHSFDEANHISALISFPSSPIQNQRLHIYLKICLQILDKKECGNDIKDN